MNTAAKFEQLILKLKKESICTCVAVLQENGCISLLVGSKWDDDEVVEKIYNACDSVGVDAGICYDKKTGVGEWSKIVKEVNV